MAHAHHDPHDHAHGGGHDHGHAGHAHGPVDTGDWRYAVGLVVNLAFVGVEFGAGLFSDSTALMADAGHNLSDVLGLLVAWGATILARSRPSHRFTYGLRSTSILAALANAMILFVACGAIGWEAAQRISAPPVVAGMTVSAIAALGILVNGLSAWLFMRGSKTDLNIRGAYLHMAADAAISLGVVVAGALMLWTGWYWLDAAVSLIIVAVIVAGTWGLLRESVRLAVSGVPAHVDMASIQEFLRLAPGVQDVHDLHVWGLSTQETALTAHLVIPSGHPGDAALHGLVETLRERFAIAHSTLQVEQGTGGCVECPLVASGGAAQPRH